MTELEPSTPEITAKTFDEVSMERSMSFVKALQELKNLRPQLYSAAEYCEKSYLHSDQKQMVLDNVKDYAVRALVNAVDHLGTVAYKLADLLEQQTSDVSGMELKVSCLDQKILTCCTYMNNEGLRQQQLLALIPRHHKHYILPSSVSKKVHFSPRVKSDPKQNYFQARAHDQSLGDPALKTISWHIGSENKSTLKGAQAQEVVIRTQEPKNPGKTNGNFHLLDYEESIQTKSSQMFGTMHRDPLRSSKPLRAFKSFDNQEKGHLVRVPVRSRSLLSSFFAKQKPSKRKAG